MEDLIDRQDAIDLVRDVCDAILSECGCHYDSEVEDEVYDDIHEVSTILKCNKAIRKSLMDLPSTQPISENDLIELQDRYGDEVRFVVEDMLSGEEKRWTTLSADRRR